MRNGCAHIIYVIGHFSKTRPKRSHHPTAKIEEKRGRERKKEKNFLFLSFFALFGVLPPFSFFLSLSLFLPISLHFYIALLLLLPDFLTSSERVERKNERGGKEETK
jgi:hypothetical protein